MRILHAHKFFTDRDGAGRYMTGLMRVQQAAGHVVAPFATHDPRNAPTPWAKYFAPAFASSAVAPGLGALRQVAHAAWSTGAAKAMGNILDVFVPDIVHVHNIYTHLSPSVLAACARRDIPVVMTVHDYALVSANYALWGGDAPLRGDGVPSFFAVASSRFIKDSVAATAALELVARAHRATGAYTRHIAAFVVPSRAVGARLEKAGIPASRLHVIAPLSEPPREVVRRDKGYVLFVGRLERYKGAHVLLEAMRAFPEVPCWIVGEGSEREALELQATGMRNVRFTGFLSGEALWDAYAGARVAVVPSVWDEPFGLVALEAMHREVPVVVSDRGGLPDIVEDGKSGLVHGGGNARDLARCLGVLFSGNARAAAMGRAARTRAGEVGDPGRHLAAIMALYERVFVDNSSN